MIKYIYLIGVPIFVALSWVIGGQLVKSVPPSSLAVLRLLVGGALLGILNPSIFKTYKSKGSDLGKWLGKNALLSVFGRVLYFYFSIKALLTIPATHAVLVTTLLPIFSLISGLVFRMKVLWVEVVIGLVAMVFVGLAVINRNVGAVEFVLEQGHIYIFIAMFSMAFYMVAYTKFVKEKSAAEPLFVQYIFAGLVLLFFSSDWSFVYDLTPVNWLHLVLYSTVCTLFPFVFMHHAFKSFSAFAVSVAAISAPVFGVIFQAILFGVDLSQNFMIFGGLGLVTMLIFQVVKKKKAI